MNVFIRAMVRIFSFGENGMFQSTRLRLVDWNTPFSPDENILTIALINIHYLYNVSWYTLQHCTKVLGIAWATTFTAITAMNTLKVAPYYFLSFPQ